MIQSLAKLIILVVLCLLYSCSSGVKDIVKGFWTINFMEYSQNQEILYEFGTNILIFKKKNECTIPAYREDYRNPSNRQGIWKITQQGEQYFLTINTENEIFAGTHKICFKKDYQKKLIKMIIQSDYLYIESSKFMFNFDRDNKIIDNYLCW
ncbi:MAG: hypothetical protein LBR81_08900 [Prevotellaceae bacterium]|jgi:hypothetical protein|nr:hypothetical protein [Prevotellaceae bacterium]